MDITLDHFLVPAHDRVHSASLLAQILDLPWNEEVTSDVPWQNAPMARRFSAVFVNTQLTLEFDEIRGPIRPAHFCFCVNEERLTHIVERLNFLGIPYRSTPRGSPDGQLYRLKSGGCGFYWSEPDGHVWEVLTASYARQKN
jgi:hypothetical protein